MIDIIEQLNLENGSNYKLAVLKEHKDNELFKRVLKMTYDKVAYTYGVTIKNAQKHNKRSSDELKEATLEQALNYAEDYLCTRRHTGYEALEHINDYLEVLCASDRIVFTLIINRDLRINVGKTQINKVFPGLITKPTYMRCDIFSKKTAINIQFPAIVQLKADGTYREFTVDSNVVTSRSRSGEDYEYPIIFEQMKNFPDGVYVGELTVAGISDRSQGNGLINSDNPPHEDIILELWDYISLEEYSLAAKKDKKNPCTIKYENRLVKLQEIILTVIGKTKNIKIIQGKIVNTLKEALEQTSKWMNEGYEGAILKDLSGVFKDGTSKHQLKLKLEIDAEMRIVGFKEGNKGTKREGKIGSMIFENDEGTIKGSCSGFTDAQLDDFTSKQDELIGKIITVQFNDLTKAEGHDYYALSHPRWIEMRNDKDETDTLEKVLKLREMAMGLK